jgi:transaldolase
MVNTIEKLREHGQSLWIGEMSHSFFKSRLLKEYIKNRVLTGMISHPKTFSGAIESNTTYDAAIQKSLKKELLGEELFYEIEISALRQMADLFRPVYQQTEGSEGWVSLAASPLVIDNNEKNLEANWNLYRRVKRPNILIEIPATKRNLAAIEEAVFLGIPINATLLFSRQQYLSAAAAFIRGVERRVTAGLDPRVGSIASVHINPWGDSMEGMVPDALYNTLGIAIAGSIYQAYRGLRNSQRWKRLQEAGARFQRLLWAESGLHSLETREPSFYINSIIFPRTINALNEETIIWLTDSEEIGTLAPPDDNECEEVLKRFKRIGVDIDSLAGQLQTDAVARLVKMWIEMLMVVANKSAILV